MKRRQRLGAARATREPAARAWRERSPGPFRHALATARQAAGMTQAALASKLGTTQSAIARLERGEVSPTVTTLSRLADALGVRFEVGPRARLAVRVDTPRGLTLTDLAARRDELLRIAAGHGAHRVRVFGSVARGEARPDSDVDFLVEFEPQRTVLDLSGLILDLEEALGRRVDVVETRHPSGTDARNDREAVPL